MNNQPHKDLDFYLGKDKKQFSMLNLPAIFADISQNPVVRSLAHLAYRNQYCNVGSVMFQMNKHELDIITNAFLKSGEEIEPYCAGKVTLSECPNLNTVALFCLLLARLEGEVEIKEGMLQTGFKNMSNMLQQEVAYRYNRKAKPNYAKMSILN